MAVTVTMYGTAGCTFCRRAEQLLRSKGVNDLNTIEVDAHPGQLQRMIERSGRRSVPQIFIADAHVGGFDDLAALERSGRLDVLLAGLPRSA
ncbi:MAG: glutaredoxin 3 [Betaproteobacteria bacterium RIFCSPLOWO2_12_FULL_67_28]|nr:MAG: glutaredoxin 3 [Betaproteobacteria bacterium RIFCSPLOWO2_12_FULL_67_28]